MANISISIVRKTARTSLLPIYDFENDVCFNDFLQLFYIFNTDKGKRKNTLIYIHTHTRMKLNLKAKSQHTQK